MSSEQASEYDKNSFKSIQSAIKRHLQDRGGTLILFEGGNLKAATTFLMENWKQEAHEPHRSPEKTVQINKHI